MGVVTCVECGGQVNEAAGRCPQCGADPRVGLTDDERDARSREAVLDPLTRARLARERGRRFLEIAVPLDQAELRALPHARGGSEVESATAARADVLAAVEDEGWRLVGASYVATGMRYDRDALAFLDSGPVQATSVAGIYLFQAAGAVADVELAEE
jgi:hypothetical protein